MATAFINVIAPPAPETKPLYRRHQPRASLDACERSPGRARPAAADVRADASAACSERTTPSQRRELRVSQLLCHALKSAALQHFLGLSARPARDALSAGSATLSMIWFVGFPMTCDVGAMQHSASLAAAKALQARGVKVVLFHSPSDQPGR